MAIKVFQTGKARHLKTGAWILFIFLMVVVAMMFAHDNNPPLMDAGEADTFAGFFLAQEIKAGRCDEILQAQDPSHSSSQLGIHDAIVQKFTPQLFRVRESREAFYRENFGGDWQSNMEKVNTEATQRIEAMVRVTSLECRYHDVELEKRYTLGWDYIQGLVSQAKPWKLIH